MGRSEHFQQGSSEHTFPPLYHGSGTLMKPGTLIKPGGEGVAFATSHRDTAAMFASHNSNNTLEGSLGKYSKPEYRQLAMFHPVYSVEPAEDTETGFKNPEYHASKKGFKIKGIHSWTSEGEPLTESSSSISRRKESAKRYKKQQEDDPL